MFVHFVNKVLLFHRVAAPQSTGVSAVPRIPASILNRKKGEEEETEKGVRERERNTQKDTEDIEREIGKQ